jgi:hypothetical protein
MPVQIRIDQAAHPPGIAGQAREDLALASPVTLTAVGGPFLEYLWRVVDKPIDIDTNTRSAALLSAANASSTLLTPIDFEGTYFVEISVDSGSGLGARADDIARITFYAGTALPADPTQLPIRQPAFGERLEHNAPDLIDPLGNPEGWARTWRRWFRFFASLRPGRALASARVNVTLAGPPPTFTIARQQNVASITYNAISQGYDVLFTTALPDANYLVRPFVLSTGAAPRIAATGTLATTGFTFWTLTTAPAIVTDSSWGFAVELGA